MQLCSCRGAPKIIGTNYLEFHTALLNNLTHRCFVIMNIRKTTIIGGSTERLLRACCSKILTSCKNRIEPSVEHARLESLFLFAMSGFKSRPHFGYSEFSAVVRRPFSSTLKCHWKIDNDGFLPGSFQFTFRNSTLLNRWRFRLYKKTTNANII